MPAPRFHDLTFDELQGRSWQVQTSLAFHECRRKRGAGRNGTADPLMIVRVAPPARTEGSPMLRRSPGLAAVFSMVLLWSWGVPSFVLAQESSSCDEVDPQEWQVSARELEQQQAEYDELGDWRQQEAADVWNDVAFGTMPFDLNVNGQVYTSEQISTMSEDGRKILADAFLEQYSNDGETALEDANELWEEQAAWLDDPVNRAYAEYLEWVGDVENHDDGGMEYWEEITDPDSRNYSPNAAIYYRKMLREQRVREGSEVLTSIDAYLAVMHPSGCEPIEI